MRKQYYAFEWVVRPMKEINLLIQKNDDIDYDLSLMNYSIVHNAVVSFCFVIGVDSEQDLRDFQVKIGLKLDVCNWRVSSHGEFERGLRFPDLFQGTGYGSWMDVIIATGCTNLAVMEQMKISQQGKRYHYYFCNWMITIQGLAEFPEIYKAAETMGLILYRFYNSLLDACHSYRIGIRVSSEELLDQFVEQAGKRIGLTDWQPMNENEFYSRGVPFVYSYDLENFMKDNQQYAAENQNKGCSKLD